MQGRIEGDTSKPCIQQTIYGAIQSDDKRILLYKLDTEFSNFRSTGGWYHWWYRIYGTAPKGYYASNAHTNHTKMYRTSMLGHVKVL